MATTPPTELPPFPTQPAQPDPAPTELPSPQPDVDIPDATPDGNPGVAPAQPYDEAPFAPNA